MNSSKKRVFICGLSQESNSFNPVLTEMDQFASFGICEGEEAIRLSAVVHGMVTCLTEKEIQPVYGVIMRAGSGGPIHHGVVEWFLKKVVAGLQAAGEVDGVLVYLHGATMSDQSDDVCGDILEAVRVAVGEKMPISASFDLHGNITDKILQNADYVSGFQAYPHLDQFETGVRAAARLAERLEGKTAKTVAVKIPMIAPAHGYTTMSGSLEKLVGRAKQLIATGEIIDYTLFQVQPWLDAKEMATTVIVIAEDEEKAKAVAKNLAKENFAIREELLGEPLMSISEVIEKAQQNKTGKPVVLVDSADSPNAGATADCAAVLEALLPFQNTLKCAVAVSDAAAVEQAIQLGVGAKGDFMLGGGLAPKLSKPVLVKDAVVKSLHDGVFYMYGPQDKGYERNIGKTAILQVGKLSIHVSTAGRAEGDLNFYRSFGIEPLDCDLVDVKACTSFRAAYEPVAAEICNTNTPGAAGPVLTDLPFEKRPVPMFPFEEITEQDIQEPRCYR